jgi:hypothetical protein
MILPGAGKQIARLARGGWSKTMHTYSAARSIYNNPFSLCCLPLSFSLSLPSTQYRNHDDIQLKKEGRKREKKHMEEEASLEMQQTQECPFHYFSSSFGLFFVLSVTEFAHSF